MLVEDDDELRWLVRTWLTRLGWTVTECATGSAGLITVSESEPGSVDLVLLDVLLPDMDGRRLYQRIREHGNIPVLVTSAVTDGVTPLAPFDGILAKPFRRAAFETTVAELVERSRNAGAGLPGALA